MDNVISHQTFLNYITTLNSIEKTNRDVKEKNELLNMDNIIMNRNSINLENVDDEHKLAKHEFISIPTTETSSVNSMKINQAQKIKTNSNDKKENERKNFPCTYPNCGKSFTYKWILDRHINSHFCFKLFKCEYKDCSKAYKSKENLNLHIKNKHLGEKPYQCKYCDSRFSHRNGN